MSDSNDAKFHFKAVINKQKTKVLFAEIGSDFADVLFSFLTIPLGKIVRVLEKHYGEKAPVFGSLTSLYNGLLNLDGALFWEEGCKQMLLNPASSFSDLCCQLKLDVGDTQSTKYFSCEDRDCSLRGNSFGMYIDTLRCDCGKQMNKEVPVRIATEASDGVFTLSNTAFILSDDLEILPNTTTSVTKIVSDLGLVDIDGAEWRNVTFGFNEIMDLLKGSLLATTPLTDIILKKQMEYEPSRFQNEKTGIGASGSLRVKVILQKSTCKLLFVESEQYFLDFLFSCLAIPLGKVENLLGGNTCLKNIDNLYRSIANPIDFKFLRDTERTRLISPTLPRGYLSNFRMFYLVEEQAPKLYYKRTTSSNEEYFVPIPSPSSNQFKSPKGDYYVKPPRNFMVTDDLTVIPLCMTSYLSAINEQKIPLSDVGELVLNIGSQEAKCILKASLTSTCALSNGLGHLLKI